jgi:hypothetical protein
LKEWELWKHSLKVTILLSHLGLVYILNGTTDYIVAYPINQDELSNIDTTGWLVTQIPECQAYITDLDGSYEQLQPTHYAMMDRLQADNQFENNTHTIEEYIVWSENETELKTRVIYTIK